MADQLKQTPFTALHVAAGAFTRATSWLLAIGLAYIFLLDRMHYLNHWYLMVLLAVLLAVTPAGADLSVDTWLRPERRRRTVPAWSVGILRAQLAIVYFYGGLAKLDGEWLAGRPLTLWLGRKGDGGIVRDRLLRSQQRRLEEGRKHSPRHLRDRDQLSRHRATKQHDQ